MGCPKFAVHIANVFAIISAALAIASLVSKEWVKNTTTSFTYGILTFYNGSDQDYYNWNQSLGLSSSDTSLSNWPSNEWAAAYVLVVIGIVGTLLAILFGLIGCCVNCCCAGFPFSIVSAIFSFISFILYWTALMLFASQYDSTVAISATLSQPACGSDSGYFKLGACTVKWGMGVAIANVVVSFITFVFYVMGGKFKKEEKNVKA
eukprot:Pgem_evm1s4822